MPGAAPRRRRPRRAADGERRDASRGPLRPGAAPATALADDRRAGPTSSCEAFDRDGFLVVPEGFVDDATVERLRERFDRLFAGDYETGHPARRGELGRRPRPGGPHAADLQRLEGRPDDRRPGAVRADRPARRGADRAGTASGSSRTTASGSRPGRSRSACTRTGAISTTSCPSEMVTCWIALDDTSAEAGTITFARGSHHWPRSPENRGEFHAPPDWLEPMRRAAPEGEEVELVPGRREGRRRLVPPLQHVPRLGPEHGDGPPARRDLAPDPGLGASSDPEHVDPVYSRYRRVGETEMDESYFPVVWTRDGGRSAWLDDSPAAA